MVVSTDKETAKRLRKLRVHGAENAYYHDEVGLNSRLDSLQAAVLRVKLRYLEEWNDERREIAGRYFALFSENGLTDIVTLPRELQRNRHIYHQYEIRTPERDELQKYLDARGITGRVYYPLSLHMQKCFQFLGLGIGDFPVSERLSEETLALPIFPGLRMEEQRRVVEAVKNFFER